MKQIDVSTKKYPNSFVIVDDRDFEWLSKWRWCRDTAGYAVRHEQKNEYGDGKRRMRKMHREIMRGANKEIDHINHNGLDNRRSNLRAATTSQNQANSKGTPLNTSGYRGVCKYNINKPNVHKLWGARIVVNGQKYFKGMFYTKEEAAIAYNEMAIKYFGQYANLNRM